MWVNITKKLKSIEKKYVDSNQQYNFKVFGQIIIRIVRPFQKSQIHHDTAQFRRILCGLGFSSIFQSATFDH